MQKVTTTEASAAYTTLIGKVENNIMLHIFATYNTSYIHQYIQ